MSTVDQSTLNTLMEDKEFVVKMMSQETPEDVQTLFRENGVDFTLEEVKEFGRELERLASTGGELNEEMLDAVSGGVVITAATAWAAAKCVIAIGGAALAIYKWYKSR